MANKFGLGRGLGSLIPVSNNSEQTTDFVSDDQIDNLADISSDQITIRQKIEYIDPGKIVTSHFQPRQLFEHTALEELINSIKEFGIIEPLIVSPLSGGNFKLVAGERRLRAAKILNLKSVPVMIRSVSEQQRLEISLIENVQRRDLTPLEEANAYKKLIDEFGLTQESLAKKVGKSRSKIANSLRLLNLPAEVQALLGNGRLSEGHAKVILELSTPQEQILMARRVAESNISVREVEKNIAVRKGKNKPPKVLDERLQSLQDELRQVFKTKVYIKPKKQGGVVEIEYYSDEELNNLIDRLGM